jgi:hypothetical protein
MTAVDRDILKFVLEGLSASTDRRPMTKAEFDRNQDQHSAMMLADTEG